MPQQLKTRWTADLLTVADQAFSGMDALAAHQGKPPPFPFLSPFGEFEGRADFRHVRLRETPTFRTIENADLTGAPTIAAASCASAH